MNLSEFNSRLRLDNNGCLVWTMNRHPEGYGGAWHNGKLWRANRLAWLLNRGPIPEGMMVLHRCDNPPCCNINHLFLGTTSENYADSLRKGRATLPPRMVGTANASAKLTEQQVREIRRIYAEGELNQRELAEMFGVKTPTVADVVRWRHWKHVV